jgi:two-component system, NtrC family, sensor kinase
MNPQVLIVDDSLTVRKDLEDAFSEAGFHAILCADLAGARRALKQEPIVLAVLDVLLPDGDGLDLLREIRANSDTANMPVLLLSTEADVRDRVRGLVGGADGYLGKPYDRHHVINRARELLRQRPPRLGTGPAPVILVIEDSLTFRQELCSALEASGYAVCSAETGEDGLRLAAQLQPHAVVVDGHLPGIDGATVIHRLRSDTALRHISCLMLTASMDKEYELRALDAGADSYVRKEEGSEVILSRLATVLRSAVLPTVLERQISPVSPKRILAVDDSPTFLNAVTQELEREDYDVIQAQSGEEALRMLAAEPVDCILLDLVMPGMTGEEACRRIKSIPRCRDIPVMILTAHKDQEALLSCLRAGADDYIPKAVEFDVLKGRVRAQLRRSNTRAKIASFRK